MDTTEQLMQQYGIAPATPRTPIEQLMREYGISQRADTPPAQRPDPQSGGTIYTRPDPPDVSERTPTGQGAPRLPLQEDSTLYSLGAPPSLGMAGAALAPHGSGIFLRSLLQGTGLAVGRKINQAVGLEPGNPLDVGWEDARTVALPMGLEGGMQLLRDLLPLTRAARRITAAEAQTAVQDAAYEARQAARLGSASLRVRERAGEEAMPPAPVEPQPLPTWKTIGKEAAAFTLGGRGVGYQFGSEIPTAIGGTMALGDVSEMALSKWLMTPTGRAFLHRQLLANPSGLSEGALRAALLVHEQAGAPAGRPPGHPTPE